MIVAYLNENACNPVLREQSKVTIDYFSGSVLIVHKISEYISFTLL